MRKGFCVFIGLLALAASAGADTIYLKNGSKIIGKVASFSDEQFVVMLDTGSDRSLSRATIHVGDVARIEFDGSGQTTSSVTSSELPREPAVTGKPKEQEVREDPVRTTGTQPTDTPPATAREPDTGIEPPPESSRTSGRRSNNQVQTTTVDVVAKRDWTSTGLIVKRGERIRITATGSVILDPASGQTSGPEGTDIPDSKKLMQDRPTGALIAVIGADNDDFIFVGRSADFSVTRDGLLFLSVNEGTLSDNAGAYKVAIEKAMTRNPSR